MRKYISATLATVVIAVAGMAGSDENTQAFLEDEYTSCRDKNQETPYGSLFLNVGHIRLHDSRRSRDYRRIRGNGNIVGLPEQDGYCFVLNHYNREHAGQSHRYTVSIVKRGQNRSRLKDGSSTVSRLYRPTNEVTSCRSPDVCIEHVEGCSSIDISFSSTDGNAFHREISFTIR